MVKIEDVKVFPLKKKVKNLVANVQFKYGDMIVKANIIDGSKGLFVSMPSRSYTDKEGNKKYDSYHYFLSQESRDALTKEALSLLKVDSQDSGPEENQSTNHIPF